MLDFFSPGPELAMESKKGFSCLSVKFSSSNFSPYIDSPPVPSNAVKSPPWIMNDLMTRWKIDPGCVFSDSTLINLQRHFQPL